MPPHPGQADRPLLPDREPTPASCRRSAASSAQAMVGRKLCDKSINQGKIPLVQPNESHLIPLSNRQQQLTQFIVGAHFLRANHWQPPTAKTTVGPSLLWESCSALRVELNRNFTILIIYNNPNFVNRFCKFFLSASTYSRNLLCTLFKICPANFSNISRISGNHRSFCQESK